jgi:hypothetical protein
VKLIACLSVFCGCITIGLIVYHRAKARVRFFAGLVAFCNNLSTEISFTLTPVGQVIDRYKNTYSSEFNHVLFGYRKLLEDKCDITREQCLEIAVDPWVADFFYNLGRAGSKEEADKVNDAIRKFSAYKADAEKYLTGKASIALKILIIIGIAGVVMLL